MNRPYLFLAGEFNVTMPVVFERDAWGHTMTSKKLVITDGRLHRENIPNEDIKGLIYMARTEDVNIEIANLETIKQSGVPCWPSVHILQTMTDRHSTMAQCAAGLLITDPISILEVGHHTWTNIDSVQPPFVIKIGQAHQGQDKHLAANRTELSDFIKTAPIFTGCTVEHFYEGLSTRILFIGDEVFGVQYHNDQSWIKNSVGCEYDDWEPVPGIVEHAQRVRDHFCLDVAGVDYVVEPNGTFHFLEINQYPGLLVNDRSVIVGRNLLRTKMDLVEKMSKP